MNFETKKTTDQRAEFWLQFENGTKMFAEMIDPMEAHRELIPGDGVGASQEHILMKDNTSRKEVTINADDATNEQSSRHDNRSNLENKSILKSALGKRSAEEGQEVTFDNQNESA
jgi:hypothetical protein